MKNILSTIIRVAILSALILLPIAASARGTDLYSPLTQTSDSLKSLKPALNDSVDTDRNWMHLFKKGELHLNDTTVQWPKFLKFCVGVYNWGDRVFNSYDTTYVVGTGRRWKAIVKNDNWLDSYAMDFPHDHPIWLLSDVYSSLGFYLSYMAVSVGYSVDLTNVIGNKPMNHKKLEVQFSCARFSAEAYYNENTGGSYLRRLGDYNDGHLIKIEFPGVRMRSYGLDAYYFFNNKKYAQGAAYNFNKIQKRSAGTFIAGISLCNQDIHLDFSKLPYELAQQVPYNQQHYQFFYNNYCLLGGYSYNWVFAKNFVFNISAFAPIGFNVNLGYTEATGNLRHYTPSFNIKGMTAVTYNLDDFFASVLFKMYGHWYVNRDYSFFNSIEQAAFTVGVRF